MVKFATSVLAATLLSVPVLAVASEEYERSLAESDLYGRDFNPEDDADLLTREDLEDIFGREFVEELEEREPLGFGMISKGFNALRHGVGHFHHGGSSGGHHFRHMGGFNGGGSSGGDSSQQQQQSRRDLGVEPEELLGREFIDDLEEREPLGFGMISKGFHALRQGVSHFHHGGSHGGSGGHHFRHMGGFNGGGSSGGDGSQQQQQSRREFIDDLEEREPLGFGMVSKGFHALRHGVNHFRHGGSSEGHHFRHMGGFNGGSSGGDNSQQQQQSRRDLGEEFEPEELLSREFVDDLEEREPLGFGMISKGFHALRQGVSHFHHGGSHGGSGGHHFHHMGGFSGGDNSQQQQQQSRRDLGEYGYFDELD